MSHNHFRAEAENPSGFSQDEIDALEADFATKQTLVNLACVPAGIAFALVAHSVLLTLSRVLANSDGQVGYRVPYQSVIWWFFPGFGGLCLCFEIVLQTWGLFVGHRMVDLYADWDSRQAKKSRGGVQYYDTRRLLRTFTFCIALPIGILSLLALNRHATFTQTQVYEFGYGFKKPVVHSYSDLRRIGLVEGAYDKHGKFIHRPALVMDFKDGYRWSQWNWNNTGLTIESSVGAILKEDAQNVPWVEATTVEDLPPL